MYNSSLNKFIKFYYYKIIINIIYLFIRNFTFLHEFNSKREKIRQSKRNKQAFILFDLFGNLQRPHATQLRPHLLQCLHPRLDEKPANLS